ncbi:MAG: urea ABC transporter permease subunit UrtB [Thiotrichales bacterium]
MSESRSITRLNTNSVKPASKQRAPLAKYFLGVLLLLAVTWTLTVVAEPVDLAEPMALLASKSFSDKSRAVELIIASGSERAVEILYALRDGQLLVHTADNAVVIADGSGATRTLSDAATGLPFARVSDDELTRISLNNALRTLLRSGVSRLQLNHPERGLRLAAVNEVLDRPQAETVELIRGLVIEESDSEIRDVMLATIAVADLRSDEAELQLAAVETLRGSLHPAVRAQLTQIAESDGAPELTHAAQSALGSIESKIKFYSGLETLFFGVSLGSVLVLAAIGLAITFGVMGVINMAHGELIMLGAYTTYMIQRLLPQFIDISLLLAIPAAFIVSGLVGILIERSVIRFLYGRPLETLLATFGVSLILQQLVRTLVSPQNVPVSNPSWMSGSWEINAVLSLTLNRLYILAFCLIVFVGLYFVLRRTALGLQVRAVSQNRAMARAMGVRSGRVDALTFGLGSGIAGVAGVALSQLTNVGPNLGQAYIIDSFLVVVFGGVGNLMGTLVGGLTLGIANKLMEPWSGAVLAKILVLVFIILFIQKRPRGLFPQKGRAAEG